MNLEEFGLTACSSSLFDFEAGQILAGYGSSQLSKSSPKEHHGQSTVKRPSASR
jgi:hypothetical protein